MTTLLDIIIASVVGGLLLLMAFTAVDDGMREFYNYNADAIVQRQLSHVSNVMQFDLRKMGYGLAEGTGSTVVRVAEEDRLRFLSHLNLTPEANAQIPGVNFFDTIVDTIEYEIVEDDVIDYGDTSLVVYQVNRIIKVANAPIYEVMVGKLANNKVFKYLNQVGQQAAQITAIKMVEINLAAHNAQVVLSPELVMDHVDNIYDAKERRNELRRLLRPTYSRHQRLVSRNLRR